MESPVVRRMPALLALILILGVLCAFAQKDGPGRSLLAAVRDTAEAPVAQPLQPGEIEVITDPRMLDRIRKEHAPTGRELNTLDDDALHQGLLQGAQSC